MVLAGGGTTAIASGFPIPYVTSFPCCSAIHGRGDFLLNNTYYYYHPLNLVADFTIWLAISLAVVFTVSLTTLVLAAVAGLGITLLTLLLPPLSIVRPTGGLETFLRPMGFPYEYLTYYVIYLNVPNPSRYEFALSPALADYALWAGVACALIGIAFRILRGRHVKTLNSDSQPS
jgi:DNA-binding transcriptional LysR family regulator